MLTLQEAYDDYRRGREDDLSPRSLVWVDQKVRVHLKGLLDLNLDEITPRMCRELHERLTRTSGRYSANGCLRVLKAILNDAGRTLDIPRNPVSRGVRMNKEKPAELKITMEDLPEIWRQIDGLKSDHKRVAWCALMLTGLRSHDVRSMRWENLNDGVLHVPAPKGGTDRAFDLPLSIHLLRELETLHQRSEWVFPARKSYMTELRRGDVGINPHGLRRLWRTVAVEEEVEFTVVKLCLNHSLLNETSTRYVSKAHLLPAMKRAVDKVADRLVRYRDRPA